MNKYRFASLIFLLECSAFATPTPTIAVDQSESGYIIPVVMGDENWKHLPPRFRALGLAHIIQDPMKGTSTFALSHTAPERMVVTDAMNFCEKMGFGIANLDELLVFSEAVRKTRRRGGYEIPELRTFLSSTRVKDPLYSEYYYQYYAHDGWVHGGGYPDEKYDVRCVYTLPID